MNWHKRPIATGIGILTILFNDSRSIKTPMVNAMISMTIQAKIWKKLSMGRIGAITSTGKLISVKTSTIALSWLLRVLFFNSIFTLANPIKPVSMITFSFIDVRKYLLVFDFLEFRISVLKGVKRSIVNLIWNRSLKLCFTLKYERYILVYYLILVIFIII